MAAKGDAPPKPVTEPKPPAALVVAASDPKPPEAFAEELPNAEKGERSELEKADIPEEAKADVEVMVVSVVVPIESSVEVLSPVELNDGLEDAKAAKGEAVAVLAKPDFGITWKECQRLFPNASSYSHGLLAKLVPDIPPALL